MRVTYQKRKTPRALNLDVSEISKLATSIFRIKNTSPVATIQALNGVEAMLLEIVNWDKFNRRRKDVKTNTWFSVSNDFLERLDLIDFSNDQKIIWLYLLTCRAKSKTPQFKFSIRLATFACQCDEKLLTDTIDRLQHLEMITSVRDAYVTRTQSVRDAYVTRTQSVRDTSGICALDKIRLDKIRLDTLPENADAVSAADKIISKPKRKSKPKETTEGSQVFKTYAEAMRRRYGSDNVIRDAKTNTACKRLVESVGLEKALKVVEAYVASNDKFLVDNAHSLEFMPRRIQKLLIDIDDKKPERQYKSVLESEDFF